MKVRAIKTTTIPKNVSSFGILTSEGRNISDLFVPRNIKNIAAKASRSLAIKGKAGEFYAVPLFSGKLSSIFFVGVGREEKLTIFELTRAFETLFRQAQEKKFSSVAVGIPDFIFKKFSPDVIGRILGEAALLGTYRYLKYKSRGKPKSFLNAVTALMEDARFLRDFERGVKEGLIVGESINIVRDYGNAPSNEVTPDVLANLARETARQTGEKVTILNEAALKKLKMGGILGVSAGSKHEARLIVLEHMKGKKGEKPIVFIGKGITFDSGGISIKPSQAMEEMKFDMSGGGAVIGAMRAIGLLKLPLNIVGLVPATENVPSGTSYKPGDVLTYSDGTTVEVINTDAEGRLILADALIYARKYKPETVIDLATLTGAIIVALGDFASGLFANNESLARDIEKASEESGEKVWRMPLPYEYADRIKSHVADLRNTTIKSGGGSITAAKFLEAFILKGTSWAHLDIAGTAWLTDDRKYQSVGATGTGVRLLLSYLRRKIQK